MLQTSCLHFNIIICHKITLSLYAPCLNINPMLQPYFPSTQLNTIPQHYANLTLFIYHLHFCVFRHYSLVPVYLLLLSYFLH